MFGVVVIPRHAIVRQKRKELVPVLFDALLERSSDFSCAILSGDVFNEFFGGSSVLAQMSCLQSVPVDSFDNFAEKRAESAGDGLQFFVEWVLCKSSSMSRMRRIRHFCWGHSTESYAA